MVRDMSIREAREEEYEAIAEHSRLLAQESENLDLDIKVLQSGALAVLKDRAKGVWYVIEVAGQVVAQMMITYEWSDWRNSNMWWIQSVYVRAKHRRMGLFKQLYNHVKTEAAAANAGGLRLYVDKTNMKAQKTYEAMGMKCHYLCYEESFKGY